VIARPDLVDRAVVLTLAHIPDEGRRTEAEIWADFERERPKILGALLDAVVEGLRRLPDTHFPRQPRMADFAHWASACETALWPAGTFWAAYEGNRLAAVEEVLEADPVGSAVRALMADRETWSGTATDLLAELSRLTGEAMAKGKGLPQGPRALSGRLDRAATALRKIGIEFKRLKGRGKSPDRLIQITAKIEVPAAESVGQYPSEPSEPSAPETKINGHKHFEALDRRTVGAASDDTTVSSPPTVRRNPMKMQEADGSDGSDASNPASSALREEDVSQRWSQPK
jgi:hypothetical protein